MNALTIFWLASSAMTCASMLVLLVRPPPERVATALWLTGLAAAPAALPIIEFVVRTYVVTSLSDGRYYVRWSLLGGCFLALVPVVASFLDAPLKDVPLKWSIVRLVHLASWASTGVLAADMVLDV